MGWYNRLMTYEWKVGDWLPYQQRRVGDFVVNVYREKMYGTWFVWVRAWIGDNSYWLAGPWQRANPPPWYILDRHIKDGLRRIRDQWPMIEGHIFKQLPAYTK